MEDSRDELIRDLHWSLCGPRPDESMEEMQRFAFLNAQEGDPSSRFITGILSPVLGYVDDEDSLDNTPFSSTGCSDSSFGFTFGVPDEQTGKLELIVNLSHYIRSQGIPWNSSEKDVLVNGFQRVPCEFNQELELRGFENGEEQEWDILTFGPEADVIKLNIVHRNDLGIEGGKVFTVSVFHVGKAQGNRRPWDRTAFHVSLRMRSKSGLVHLPSSLSVFTEDAARSDLLYREVKRYAIGHGCGVQCIEDEEIRSTFFPEETVPVYTHRNLESNILSMLAWANRELDFSALDSLPQDYENWLREQSKQANDLTSGRRVVFQRNVKAAEKCIERMRNGIRKLKIDQTCQRAFTWMNEAMLVQQIRTKLHTVFLDNKNGQWQYGAELIVEPLDATTWPPELKHFGRWRLFQLAFVLMCLDDLNSDDGEDYLDLIWFPTGGGKTEAYLGLSAYLLLHDRLSKGDDKGVKILMRYTLRLLTSQQFERASALILSLEDIRKRMPELGQQEFSIGLWVGSSVTFNRQLDAARWYDALDTAPWSSWDWVLQRCPRCAREFGLKREGGRSIPFGVVKDEQGHVHLSCSCSGTNSRLPIHIIDEDIYNELPSLVVATVDKFARLPWKPVSSKLLGVNAKGRGEHSKLSLIIQDELHLMDGPLGTIAGLYEAGIDYLISSTGAKPKRIGSSATLAMAPEQCRDLYGVAVESVCVFPTPVLNWEDNYYSYVSKSSPGRKYVGLYANGSPSNKTTQYKMFASLMRTGARLGERGEDVSEGYTTLVNYFNSRRDQGQALSLMGDDVPRELRLLASRNNDDQQQYIDISDQGLVQLHGNVRSDEVQRSFTRLAQSYGQNRHVRTVLATNMISVGLDVSRLGLLTIVHQPKSMAEYIQASSRVGRGRTPGLVVVMLSALRSRDKSHLEDFSFTHRRMYAMVEPSSLTPFSSSALERALPGVLVTMVRNAPNFDMEDAPISIPESLKEEVKSFLLERLRCIDPDEESQFLVAFDAACHKWNSGGFQSYGKELNPQAALRPLMVPFITTLNTDVRPFQVLQAMRNVDSGLELKQIEVGNEQ
jgi:hypothetical protein